MKNHDLAILAKNTRGYVENWGKKTWKIIKNLNFAKRKILTELLAQQWIWLSVLVWIGAGVWGRLLKSRFTWEDSWGNCDHLRQSYVALQVLHQILCSQSTPKPLKHLTHESRSDDLSQNMSIFQHCVTTHLEHLVVTLGSLCCHRLKLWQHLHSSCLENFEFFTLVICTFQFSS